ncbi:MAG: DNA translocase FtsK [Candidatus Marinimicrobia bacterium]|jgi:S-DNA-T family DNA segregation ATPase FtsK/SpoIIIE|nr:DNA translocase FtsK [Candidatus Neomarinimicrobiota bacterium]MBT3691590.1 DNA translocase FtsK [Candidatus Neomarinimicrobiota bacterium]MBT3731461.1 DNA translocase FtsK [Candidatus Neomarinimicrobiota bacterium]MBT4144163.1 DNA translocase FtsK [Candidatus Neomarinimicrobiota bacterium]MBT4178528.1 DNA translocase FtsK [Candidatus Neomarinimicrobiota bacterium]
MKERRYEILGILTVALSVFIFASLGGYHSGEEPTISSAVQIENPMGIMGVFTSYILLKIGIGYSAFFIPFLGIAWGWHLFGQKDLKRITRLSYYIIVGGFLLSFTLGFMVILQSSSGEINIRWAGLVGWSVSKFFTDFLGYFGTFLVLLSAWLVLFRSVFEWSFYLPFQSLGEKYTKWKSEKNLVNNQKEKEDTKRKHTQDLLSKISENDEENMPDPIEEKEDESPEESVETFELDDPLKEENDGNEEITDSLDPSEAAAESDAGPIATEKKTESHSETQNEIDETSDALNVGEMTTEEEVLIDEIEDRQTPKREFQLPTTDLLMDPVHISDTMSRDELVDRANFLTESLATFGVVGKVVNVHPGPVITLFEVEPAEGVRVNKFVALADDLARVMEASRVRVIAPIPGKSSVGIEIPNRNPATVYFKPVINSQKFVESDSLLTIAVGKTTSGEIATLNLGKMPHLLIAGTTGSGKSVCINTIICSFLYRATPEELKFVMIDPKKVEMALYKKLEGYHLLKMEDIPEPIVTSTDHAILALRALEKEMDRRYNVLAEAVVRNIDEYNEKMRKNDETIMPYIVLVVDELADLMMMSAKDVEAPIARLAQLSRAVGIHLVIATQRPSVDVITGVIKANFPARIAFQVASKIDSRTIIDQTGAEKLIGRGDMLHLGLGSSDVTRLHNAFVTLDEIEALMNHIADQPKGESVVLPSVRQATVQDFSDGIGTDDLYDQAVAMVITHQQGSISLLQRRLKVGYSRAARLIDDMEQGGIVGPFTGSKAREVLVDETYLDSLNS